MASAISFGSGGDRMSAAVRFCGVIVMVAIISPAVVRADGPMMPSSVPKLYRQECSACHVPYPPGLLPAASWQRLMGSLDRHFGADASLEAAEVESIKNWLHSNAGTYKRVREAPPNDRITQSAWFVRKHHEVPADAWKRVSVRSAAHCNACHRGAAQGDYNEHDVVIPR